MKNHDPCSYLSSIFKNFLVSHCIVSLSVDHTFQFLALCKLNPNEDVECQKKPNNLYWLSAQKKKLYEEHIFLLCLPQDLTNCI
jgi:hypothetical protein